MISFYLPFISDDMSNAMRASLRQAGLQDSGRPLCTRVKEHLDGLVKSKPSSSISAHRRQCHDNTPFKIAVTFLARESDALARKTLETFYIKAKSPIMNRKEKRIAVTKELAPYQDLCGF